MNLPCIREISECFIKPNDMSDESRKPFYLGSFELMQISHCYLQIGLVFDKHPQEGAQSIESFIERLKDTLSSALAHFYPLAGQLATQVDEEEHTSFIFLDCNKGPGAMFIHAALDDTTVNDIISPAEVPSILPLLFELGQVSTNYDGHDQPLLVIQVTQLVDGVFLGVSANHSVVDGASFWHFLSSWSEIFQSNNTNITRPPDFNRWFPDGYGPIIRIPHTNPGELITRYKRSNNEDHLKELVFHFSSNSMSSLKAKANADCGMNNEISSFQALCAVLWRSIIRARGLKQDEPTSIVLVANARARVNPPLSRDYFGSFIHGAFGQTIVSELLENSLGRAAMLLNEGVKGVHDNFIRSEFVKWVKSPVFYKPGLFEPGVIVMSGSPREDVYNIEFGLGKPVATRTSSNKYDGKLVARPGKEGKGSVSLQICLSPNAMTAFQQDTEFASILSSTS